MRQKKRTRFYRNKNTSVLTQSVMRMPMKLRRVRLDDDDEEDEEWIEDEGHEHQHTCTVFEESNQIPRFTGILTEHAEPIIRVFMPKPGIGFMCHGTDEFDPDLFYYSLPNGEPAFENDEEGDEAPEE